MSNQSTSQIWANNHMLFANSRANVTQSTGRSDLYTSTTQSTDAVTMVTGRWNVTMATPLSCMPQINYAVKNGLVKSYPQDFMAVKPFNYLEDFKNPCFKNVIKINCFPYYFLVGAPKSGTTDLALRITAHPQVSNLVQKEPHWLTRQRFRVNIQAKSYPTLASYLQYFSRASQDIVASKNGSFHPKVVGDCSASTLWDTSYLPLLEENQNRSEPLHTNADFIRHLNPNAKIIAILRNPIDRLYSDYLYFQSSQKTPEHFHLSVQRTIAYYTDCFRRCSIRQCLYDKIPPANETVRLHIGCYYYSVSDYMKVFPSNQMLVLKMEDYSANMTHYMRQVFSFLELEPVDKKQMDAVTDTKRVYNANTRYSVEKTGSMLPETRRLLLNFYKPHNVNLEQLLGKKLWADES